MTYNNMQDPLIGQQLDEYRLDELLGRGGMARVYAATDIHLGRKVAIKVIDAPYRADVEYGDRFRREARAIAQLEHPHVVRLYRYGEVDELFYIAMQYVEGSDLADLIHEAKQKGALLPLEQVHNVIAQVCQALDYVHSKGVIHRDIKPSNILINQEGNAILTDFGLAMLTTTQTQGQVFGSPHYIAPEQAISSASAVPQSDLYGVGVMLYELVTGKLPFEADNALSIALMHASEAPRPPRQIQPSLSPALESVILRALAKEPHKRFASGAALMEAFDHALAEPMDITAVGALTEGKRPLPPLPAAVVMEEPQVAAPPILPAKTRSRRRGRVWAWLLLLLLAIGGGGWFYSTDATVRNWADGALMQVGLLPQPTPTPTNTPTLAPTAVPTTPPTATNTPTPTSEPTAVAILPTIAPSATAEPTQTPTTAATATAEPSLTPTTAPSATPSPTPTPTATPLVVEIRPLDQMPMVLIPSGTFNMGSEAAENEQPIHPVTLNAFYLDQFEVSVGQYAQFLNESVGVNQYASGCGGALCLKTQFEGADSVMTTNATGHIGLGETENYPVNHIRWHGAMAYCAWVGGRLPTEAEWEYAARGTEGRTYPWGETLPDETLALFGQTDGRYQTTMQPVDAFPAGATPLDIYNLAGGVSEWVADSYSADFYASAPAQNPLNTAVTGEYLLRGGAWNSPPELLRASGRLPLPQYADDPGAGFRCAYDVATN